VGLTLERNYVVIDTADYQLGKTQFLAFDGYAGWTKSINDAAVYANPPCTGPGEHVLSIADLIHYIKAEERRDTESNYHVV